MTIIRNLMLALGSISFITVIGGAAYEHLAVVPVWSSAVPASLSMFQGEYGLAASNFWIPIHPVTLGLLTAALILNWNSERRAYILTCIAGYLAVLVTTFIYFVPELLALTGSTYSTVIDGELTRRAGWWEFLSLVRLVVLILLAIILQLGLAQSPGPRSNTH